MIFTLHGDPISKMRHRSCLRHGKIHSYDLQASDKTTTSWKLHCQLKDAMESCDEELSIDATLLKFSEAFSVEFEFYMQPPASLSTPQRNRLLWMRFPIVKPDIDNLVKFYLDAANDILWPDDKKIIELKATKIYSEVPQTTIKVIGQNLMAENEKVQGILGVFSPHRYHEMLRDIQLLAEMESVPNRSQQRKAADAAYVLSRFADSYSEDLKKINKKYPGYWEGCISKEIVVKHGSHA